MMHEEHKGGLSLEQVARADRIRAEQRARHAANTRRRHGHKGARQWGYMTPGTGKGKRS